MDCKFYQDLAKTLPAVPLAAHLVLHEQPDPDQVIYDGERLGKVLVETAKRFNTKFAFPLMDLTLEKELMLHVMGLVQSSAEAETFHFDDLPPANVLAKVTDSLDVSVIRRMKASCDAISYVAQEGGDILPMGMGIGPFSLLTKLMNDPITAVYMAGSGMTADDDESVEIAEELLKCAERVIYSYWVAQCDAGAKALFNCEPAANLVYFSPNQIASGSDVFDRFVIEPNARLRDLLVSKDVDFLLHDCGEMRAEMIRSLSNLRPKVFSFGSPVDLWVAAPHVDKDIVLFGNLPSKKFYSDELTIEGIYELIREITDKMSATDHPYIIGTECDVLSMPGYEKVIMEKVVAMNDCQIA